MEHSKEPWRTCGASGNRCQCGLIWCEPDDIIIAHVVSEKNEHITGGGGVPYKSDTFFANAIRMVACVNACAGIPTEQLAAFVAERFPVADKPDEVLS